MNWFICIVFVVAFIGCSDAQIGKFKALGNSAQVECWSGGRSIFKGESTGKVSSEENSDGYYFIDKATGSPMEVSGNCVIRYND
jgi:hypothetical protein